MLIKVRKTLWRLAPFEPTWYQITVGANLANAHLIRLVNKLPNENIQSIDSSKPHRKRKRVPN